MWFPYFFDLIGKAAHGFFDATDYRNIAYPLLLLVTTAFLAVLFVFLLRINRQWQRHELTTLRARLAYASLSLVVLLLIWPGSGTHWTWHDTVWCATIVLVSVYMVLDRLTEHKSRRLVVGGSESLRKP